MYAIQAENLTKYYGKTRGILNLSLTVEAGDFFGFIGPNGAGKSTTIRSLLGLIAPSEGKALLLGKDVARNREDILQNTGYLPSEALFYPGMRAGEVLKLSADLRKKDCGREAAVLCECLELDPSRKAEELSFGNRKKLAIICALQSKPELLILDEPTGGLDPLMQHAFFEILKERNEEGTTIFMSSHILSEIERHCRRAAVIREGELIAQGSVEELAKTSAKRVVIQGEADLEGLEEIRDLRTMDRSVSFLFNGEIGRLLDRLARGQIQDVSISEPDLEEIFLHYYRKEEEA
ncbi:MAG: ABC transporter ATP-binding protein [Lachnospiraceae bacterium]|nr:ABC transporter ATP-binding protein [Lachnospiraceae bacterium]